MQNRAYTFHVSVKKTEIGPRNPERITRHTNAAFRSRMSGFFVCSYHFYGEACGQLRAGRYLVDGVPNPQCLATPIRNRA